MLCSRTRGVLAQGVVKRNAVAPTRAPSRGGDPIQPRRGSNLPTAGIQLPTAGIQLAHTPLPQEKCMDVLIKIACFSPKWPTGALKSTFRLSFLPLGRLGHTLRCALLGGLALGMRRGYHLEMIILAPEPRGAPQGASRHLLRGGTKWRLRSLAL